MKTFKVVGCMIRYQDKFLILQRDSNKPEGNERWLPAGKVEEQETDKQTCIREVFEETWIKILESPLQDSLRSDLIFIWEFVFDFPDKKVIFPTFSYKLFEPVEIKLSNSELQNYKRITPKECLEMKNTILWLDEIVKKNFNLNSF